MYPSETNDSLSSTSPSGSSPPGVNCTNDLTHECDLGDGAGNDDLDPGQYIFHQPEVKVPLLLLYTIVFIFAFFGNALVVLVMVLHRRMRSHTNFFLTNLAVADLCVAVFCVYQNFAMYVIHDWYLGEFLCVMYQFVSQLSYTASVIILVVVGGERYLAIVEPLKAKALLTRRNMIVTMVLVWVFSALYSCPRLMYFKVQEYPVGGGRTEAMCLLRRDKFDTEIWDMVSLLLLYLLPLALLSILYARIAHTLCCSGRLLAAAAAPYRPGATPEYGTFKSQHTASLTSSSSSGVVAPPDEESGNGGPMLNRTFDAGPHVTRGSVKSVMSTYVSMASVRDEGHRVSQMDAIPLTPRTPSRRENGTRRTPTTPSPKTTATPSPRVHRRTVHLHPSPLVLRARRKVINMLVVVVVSFAVCSLPFHSRKVLQYYLASYQHNAPLSYVLTPVTFLLMYANSAVNPVLYTFMSRKFRNSSVDLLTCRLWQGRPTRPQRPTLIARLSGRDKVVTHLV